MTSDFCDFEKYRNWRNASTQQMPEFEDCQLDVGHGGFQNVGCVSRLDYVRPALAAGLAEHKSVDGSLELAPSAAGVAAAISDTSSKVSAPSPSPLQHPSTVRFWPDRAPRECADGCLLAVGAWNDGGDLCAG